jgi:hypothetical protein
LGAGHLLLPLELVSMVTGIYQHALPSLVTVHKVPIVHFLREATLVICAVLKVIMLSAHERTTLDPRPHL